MGTESHARRYRFQPTTVEPLERRQVPSATATPVALRDLAATVEGSAHSTAIDPSKSGVREVDFAASGKDKAGHPVELSGSLVTYDPASYSYMAGTFGSATLTTRHATYHFRVNGPTSDLDASSGVSNMHFSITKSGGAKQPVISVGSMQVYRQAMPDGGQQVTATIVTSAPWKTRTKRS